MALGELGVPLICWAPGRGYNAKVLAELLNAKPREIKSFCLVCGLHAASSGLRHADIRTTSAFYADRRVKVTPGLARRFRVPQPIDGAAPHTKGTS
jgi:hypothetical protein